MTQNSTTRTDGSRTFDPGKELFSWTAHDYHPHKRGMLWLIVFSVFMFGVAAWSYISDPETGWITALTLLLALSMYFYMHRNGDEHHEISVFENGVFVDQFFISRSEIEGYWFVYDETASVLNLEKKGKYDRPVQLQMGEVAPDTFRAVFSRLEFEEMTQKQESIIDLWVRALKM